MTVYRLRSVNMSCNLIESFSSSALSLKEHEQAYLNDLLLSAKFIEYLKSSFPPQSSRARTALMMSRFVSSSIKPLYLIYL